MAVSRTSALKIPAFVAGGRAFRERVLPKNINRNRRFLYGTGKGTERKIFAREKKETDAKPEESDEWKAGTDGATGGDTPDFRPDCGLLDIHKKKGHPRGINEGLYPMAAAAAEDGCRGFCMPEKTENRQGLSD